MAKKYIDAELLRKKVEKYYDDYRLKFNTEGDPYYLGVADGLDVAERVIKSLQQEQPSEELEAEIEKYFDGWNDDPEYGQAVLPHTYECVGVSDCKDIARHFYILGLKNNIPVTQITLDELAEKDWGILQDMSIGEEEEED